MVPEKRLFVYYYIFFAFFNRKNGIKYTSKTGPKCGKTEVGTKKSPTAIMLLPQCQKHCIISSLTEVETFFQKGLDIMPLLRYNLIRAVFTSNGPKINFNRGRQTPKSPQNQGKSTEAKTKIDRSKPANQQRSRPKKQVETEKPGQINRGQNSN